MNSHHSALTGVGSWPIWFHLYPHPLPVPGVCFGSNPHKFHLQKLQQVSPKGIIRKSTTPPPRKTQRGCYSLKTEAGKSPQHFRYRKVVPAWRTRETKPPMATAHGRNRKSIPSRDRENFFLLPQSGA